MKQNPSTHFIRERYNQFSRNASGMLIFTDELHECESYLGLLLSRISEEIECEELQERV